MFSALDVSLELGRLRKAAPLVHNITNYVAMNFTANALLALGASPVMAHAKEEVDEMVGLAGSLVVNMGTLSSSWVESMILAMRRAKTLGKPIVFDPVGVGATEYRNEVAQLLLEEGRPDVIRGNASEILALMKMKSETKGVDSAKSSDQALNAASQLSKKTKAVVCVSGASDFIVDQSKIVEIKNGHVLMTKVTAMGCAATAIIGAFAALVPSLALATQSAMACMGVAGEMAAEKCQGPGSFQVAFLDALYSLNADEIFKRLRCKNSI